MPISTDAVRLSAVPLFSGLPAEVLEQVAALLRPVSIRAGDVVFLEREPGDALYVVESGSVRIWVRDADANEVTLTELAPGSFFGEMAVLDGGPRSANATATAEGMLRCLRRQDFERFFVEHPSAALTLLRNLSARLRQTNQIVSQQVTRNANVVHEQRLSRLDTLALAITNKVGSVGFFLIIATWTIVWTGYNIIASSLPGLGWPPFDPFPAFVAYLLMSNVIQILLMPLIMVGQNLQARHAEIRAELEFEINERAEKEVVATLRHLERNTQLLVQLMHHLDCRVARVEAEDRAPAAHVHGTD